jgi:Zn-finger nucleic acid-binding protein
MTELETRWPCPVCLGVKLEKVKIGEVGDAGEAGSLMLDHCPRCGGVWFELGEIRTLGDKGPDALWSAVERREEPHRAQCHACRAYVDRDADRCPACGEKTRLECPHCQQMMRQVHQGELVLDVCERCKGVWFDHHELASIWRLERDKLVAQHRERGSVARAAEEGSSALLEALIWAPDLVFYGAHAAGHAVAAVAEGMAAAPEAIGVAADAVAEAASSVFEVMVEIVAGIFS